jgi:signal transduction histidine kinase
MPTRIKILHLEDSIKDAELIHSIIEEDRIEHDYFLADNKTDFLKILTSSNIDIILSDYSLPDYNGKEALAVSRKKYPTIPFIFISGTMGEDAAINAMLDGATDYVLKYKLERLVPAIKRALHEHQLEDKKILAKKKLKEKNKLIKEQNLKYVLINKKLITSLSLIQNINDELIISKNKAEESEKLKSAFLANMSHEIRTPLNAIIGFSGLLAEPDIEMEEISGFIQIINTNSLKLLAIISDIMDISKIEAGQLTVCSELVNIDKLMSDLYLFYKINAEKKNLELRFSCAAPNVSIEIRSDGKRISQVMGNLLNNAIKFTSKGVVEFGYNMKDNSFEFFVKDTGIGISSEYHTLVFKSFRQTEAINHQINSGNGLGLAISKALVEILGGNITLQSKPGIGSIFTFTIPIDNNV